ncbi:MAG: hypothetical protein KDI06_10950, partial [Calditrichaeota bacterium]|nr:hypothetical protein [Calditrichota bacterium]
LWAGSGENSLQKQLPGSDTWQDAEGLPDYVRLVESDGQTHLYTAGRTGRFFFSSDAGSSWDNLPATPAFNASYDLLTNRFGHVFLATDIGLCRSTTRGVTWETITEGIGPHFLQSLGSSPDNILFGGSPTDGVYKSDDNGLLWLATNLPPHPVRAIAAFDSRILLAGTASGFLFLSEDGGQNWRNSEIALEEAPINFLLILDEKAVLLGSLGAGAWLSEDRGDSWREVNRGLGDLNLISGAYDPHSATIWLGSAGRGVFEGDFTLLKEYAPSTR